MIFLDTCVWFELLSVRTPRERNEILQATAASNLFQEILLKEEEIVTCKEQIVELISSIEKAKMKEVSRERKNNNLPGVGNLKKFRKLDEFQDTKRLCEEIVTDIMHFANVYNIGNYDIDHVIQRLDLVDINDCLYYDYCIESNIDFYTFDTDLKALGEHRVIHCYKADENKWN